MFKTRLIASAAIALFLSACATAAPVSAPAASQSPPPSATCQTDCITEFSPSSANGPFEPGVDSANGIAAGKDAVWFFEVNTNKIGRITVDGAISEFSIPGIPSVQGHLAVATDGAVWFTEDRANKIVRLAADGTIVEFVLPGGTGQILRSIVAGPNGDVWYLARGTNQINHIDRAGVVTTSQVLPPLPTVGPGFPPNQGIGAGMCLGPDGAFWFVDTPAKKVGRWTAAGGVKEWDAGAPGPRIVAGPDGALWFTESAINKIGRITTDGQLTEFALEDKANPIGITAGPDGAVWFTEYGLSKIGRIAMDGQITLFTIPTAKSTPFAVVTGPDGNIWFTGGASGKIGRIRLKR